MTGYIVVRPEVLESRQQAADSDVGAVQAELAEFRDAIDDRFPVGEVAGATGALFRGSEVSGRSVHVHPHPWVRPLVLFASMEIAAELGLTVEVPEEGLVADPDDRIDVRANHYMSVEFADIYDDSRKGSPCGVVPWITRPLVERLIGRLDRAADRLELQGADGSWLRMTRCGDDLLLSRENPDGIVTERRRATFDRAGVDVAADSAWAWARGERDWQHGLEPDLPAASAA